MRQTLRGMWYVPGYGHHPGNVFAVAFPVVGAIFGGWIGFGVLAALAWPVYLYGAYERGREG